MAAVHSSYSQVKEQTFVMLPFLGVLLSVSDAAGPGKSGDSPGSEVRDQFRKTDRKRNERKHFKVGTEVP